MKPVDERILEYLHEEGNLTPQVLESKGVATANYTSSRLSKLTKYGLTQRLGKGLYRITEEGEEFLNGDLDVGELEPSES